MKPDQFRKFSSGRNDDQGQFLIPINSNFLIERDYGMIEHFSKNCPTTIYRAVLKLKSQE